MFCHDSYSSSACAGVEAAEVFRKEELETRRGMEESRGKQKRRDRVFKTKTHCSSKSKSKVKNGGDVLAQIKAKENIVAPNNGAQRITICRDSIPSLFTQKVGIYNRGKSSLMVSRRRPLHDLQPSNKTVRETEKDLKRVLGYSSDERSPKKPPSPQSGVGERRNSPMVVTGAHPPAEEPKQSSSEMELSPPPDKQDPLEEDSILAIATRIAEGLHPRMIFSDSDYLNNTKAELRKLLKQGSERSRGSQTDMTSLVASSLSNNPPTNGVFILPPVTNDTDTFFSLPPLEDQPPPPPPPPPPAPQTTDLSGLDMFHSTVFGSSPCHTHEIGPPFALSAAEVELTSTDPAYLPPFQMEPASPSPPQDFLDLLDTMQHGGIGESFARPPESKWMPTPERPKMYRQKLF